VRVSQVTIDLTSQDINEMIEEFAEDVKIQVTDIREDGIHGHVKLLLWNIDFTARPSTTGDGEVSLIVAAHKLVPIPSAIVERQLKSAVKDAPAGIDVIQQAIKVHLPSLLSPFGISLNVKELRAYQGFLRISVHGVQLPSLKQLLKPPYH